MFNVPSTFQENDKMCGSIQINVHNSVSTWFYVFYFKKWKDKTFKAKVHTLFDTGPFAKSSVAVWMLFYNFYLLFWGKNKKMKWYLYCNIIL